jgi:phage gpG-like protein
MAIKVQVEAEKALLYLSRVAKQARTLTPVLNSIGADWEGRAKLTFLEQRDPWGNSWTPLKDTTLKLRRQRGSSSTEILKDSGAMLRSVTKDVSGNTLTLSIDGPAAIHQEGNPENRLFGNLAPIPARPIFPIKNGAVDLPDAWEQGALQIVESLLEGL